MVFYSSLFHDLLLRSYLYHCVWSVITAHNLTPEKKTAVTSLSRSSVSLLLEFSAMLRVSLVSRVTAKRLHDNMLGCLSPSGEWS